MTTDIIKQLKDPVFFWTALYLANLLMYASTILFSYLWSKVNKMDTLALTKADIRTSIIVLVINIIVAFPGYFLLVYDYISFTESNFVRDILILFFGFDFAMYSLHFISHKVWPFKLLHTKHHTHKQFNAISLYVMHPMESLMFGILLTLAALLVSFNFYSFILFIIINWFL